MMRILYTIFFLGLLGICLGAGGGISTGSSSDGGRLGEGDHIKHTGIHFVALGEKFSISCVLKVNDHLQWTFNSTPIVPGESGYTVIHGPGRQGYVISRLTVVHAYPFHSGEYKCNPHTSHSHSIFVFIGSMNETDDTRSLREGKPLLLTCVENVTNMNTVWTKDGAELASSDRIQLFPNTSLYITSAKAEEDVGTYTCKTGSMIEPQIFNVIRLYLNKHLPKSTTVLENDKLSLTCLIEGEPKPTVQWLKNGEPLEDSINSTRLVFGENEYEVANASLLIEPVLKSDRGTYVCLITSFSIQFNTTTEVRVKDIYAALWPFLGIVAEVVLLCLIIFIYEKRRIKPRFEDSDTDQTANEKNNIDKKENELRQRK